MANIPSELSAAGITAMRRLRDSGHLVALRGGRLTDLAKPIKQSTLEFIAQHCAPLATLAQLVEQSLVGTDLFLRAFKCDCARASTTIPDSAAITESYFHFDAQESSLLQYSDPIWQFYMNVGQHPRQFRVIPQCYSDMLNSVVLEGEDPASLTPLTVLRRKGAACPPPVTVQVDSGSMAIFNGRVWAHDAGKGTFDEYGKFVAADDEDDFVAAIDTKRTAYHDELYNVDQPLIAHAIL
eukprot:TRINITY_DN2188_c0_g1_i1.p2 TRINITY_DN2188_c0_g1~~TRINITY_DN2188_c0_g1_i1.p2  ORF type:complete len:271 (+),score=48.39 TRINITY_DN2188_c0_g1_i1:97-813(+)